MQEHRKGGDAGGPFAPPVGIQDCNFVIQEIDSQSGDHGVANGVKQEVPEWKPVGNGKIKHHRYGHNKIRQGIDPFPQVSYFIGPAREIPVQGIRQRCQDDQHRSHPVPIRPAQGIDDGDGRQAPQHADNVGQGQDAVGILY